MLQGACLLRIHYDSHLLWVGLKPG